MIDTNGQSNGQSNGHAGKAAWRDARRERLLLEEQARIKVLQKKTQLLEAYLAGDWWTADYLRLFDRSWVGGNVHYLAPISTRYDRRAGTNYPLFRTEQELALLRGPARILCATNTYAIGLLSGLQAYVVEKGFTYRVTAKRDEVPKKFLAKVQDVLDEFDDRTLWSEWEQELFWRSREDGEFFLWHDVGSDGLTWVRSVEPEQIAQPPGEDFADWSFGIRTPREDVQRHEAYWMAYLEDSTDAGEEIPANKMIHYPVNGKRSVKRGLTDFQAGMLDVLAISDKLRRNMGEGGAIQAAFAGVREHTGFSADQVGDFLAGQKDFSQTNPVTNKDVNFQQVYPGMFVDVFNGTKFVPPPMAGNAEAHVAILQACLRSATVRYNAPEWLGSSDSSNSNYASSLSAESPFIKRVEMMQDSYGRRFKEVKLAVIRNAMEAGRLPSNTLDLVDVDVEPKSPEARDPLKDAQTSTAQLQTKLTSPQIEAQKLGNDYEQVMADWDEFNERTGGGMGQGLPMPGEGGFGQPGGGQGPPGGGPGGSRGPFGKPPMPRMPAVLGEDKQVPECGGEGSHKPGPCPQGEQTAPASPKAVPHADAHARSILSKVGGVASAAVSKGAEYVQGKYAELERDFGRAGALTILGATVALLPVPVPGTSVLPIALAKAYLALRGAGKVKATEAVEGVDDDAMVAAVKRLLVELAAAVGEEAPAVDEDAIRTALAAHRGEPVEEAKKDESGHCHDGKGHWTGCDTPGAIPMGQAAGDNPDPGKAKFVGAKVGKAEHVHSAKVEQEVATAIKGEWEEDNKFYDAKTKDGKHFLEVKSLLKGGKQAISVHPDALLRKVDGIAANPGSLFHTVAVDERAHYEGGAHAENHSGNRLYYKRGSGRYSLSQMHPVKDMAELRQLMDTPDARLPEKAKGALPSGKAVKALREAAEKTHASRLVKDRERKARLKAARLAGKGA